MTLPTNKETFTDGGVGFSSPSPMTPIVIGRATGGSVALNTLRFYTSSETLHADHNEGPGVLAVDNILAKAGGPVGFIACAGSVAGAIAAVTQVGTGPAVTLAGTAVNDAALKITVTKGGALGVGMFTYTLDGVTSVEPQVIPAGGSYVLTKSGVTATFAAGTYVLGTTYSSAITCAAPNVADLTAAFAPAASTPTKWRFAYVVTSDAVTSAAAALLAASLQSLLESMATNSKYRRGMVSACSTSAAEALTTVSAAASAPRVLVSYGKVQRVSTKAYPGFAVPTTQNADCFAARAAASVLSTDLKRVPSGNITEIVTNYHDEYATPSGLDDIKVSTLRTYDNGDVYPSQGYLRSSAGSDYRLWPHGNIIDVAAESVHAVMQRQIGRGLRTYTNTINDIAYPGVLDPRDAGPIEDAVNNELANQIGTPTNAEGTPGHVTAYKFTISKTHNYAQTGIIIGTVRIVRLTYNEGSEVSLGYVLEIPS
jgi:hypothetical protein